MKADILDGMDITEIIPQDAPEVDGWDDGFMPDDGMYIPTNNVASFEDVLQRRTSVRLNRNRVVTLRDLVRQLEFYAQMDKKAEIESAKKRAQQARRSRDLSRLTPADMVNLAHEEDYKLGASILRNNLTEILNREDRIELNELTLLGMDRITAYISLLFLVTEGEYTLNQEHFYGDLYVIKKPKTEEQVEEDAINDRIVKDTLSDDVHTVVDNVVSLHNNVKVEEYRK